MRCPRPGHADLAGALKYRHQDLRNVLERSSARETAARVAAGSVARERLLEELGITIIGQVVQLGGLSAAVKPWIGRAAGQAGTVKAELRRPGSGAAHA